MRTSDQAPAPPTAPKKFKDRLIIDAPSVDEYRARISDLTAAGVSGRPLLESLGVTGAALETAIAEDLEVNDALALAQAWGDLDIYAVWDDVPTAAEIENWVEGSG